MPRSTVRRHHEHVCSRAGIRVRYCGEQFENDGSIGSNLLKTVKRVMAGEYSRELSVKVFAGQCRLVELGFRQGGAPSYPSIVDRALFERARAIVDARTRHYSDEELLSMLRSLLEQQGMLSGLVIDEREEMPSSSDYRDRFGSLLRAHEIIGYEPGRDCRYIEINRAAPLAPADCRGNRRRRRTLCVWGRRSRSSERPALDQWRVHRVRGDRAIVRNFSRLASLAHTPGHRLRPRHHDRDPDGRAE